MLYELAQLVSLGTHRSSLTAAAAWHLMCRAKLRITQPCIPMRGHFRGYCNV
jgi:hypothetical protein